MEGAAMMDGLVEKDLAAANRHVADAEARVARQAALVAAAQGGDPEVAAQARALLATFERVLATQRRHRHFVSRELEREATLDQLRVRIQESEPDSASRNPD